MNGDISLWDLKYGIALAVFSPDSNITSLTTTMDGKLILFGLADTADVVTLRLLVAGQAELVM